MKKELDREIIFVDTEFSTLNPYKGELLSIAAIKMNGEEFYCELEHDGFVEEWVEENVVPSLTGDKVSREEAKQKLIEFVGEGKPYMLAYINQYDSVYLAKLFNHRDSSPFHWLPLDFASIIVGLGYLPEDFRAEEYTKLAKGLGVEVGEGHNHNALDDARLLRKVHLALLEKHGN